MGPILNRLNQAHRRFRGESAKEIEMTSMTMRNLLVSLFVLALLNITSYAQGNFVYVNRNADGANSVTAFSVAGSGALTEIAGSPFLTGGTGNDLGFYASNRNSVCMAGSRLYVSNQGSNNITGFNINPSTGALTTVPGSPFASGGLAGGVGTSLDCSPDSHFLVAANGGSNNITVFAIAANGALTPVAGIAALNPDGIKISPNGRFLYVAEPNSFIEAFSIAFNGSLTPVPGSPFPGGLAVAGMEVNCAGTLLFAPQALGGGTTVNVFSIGSDGALTPVAGSPFAFASGSNSNVGVLSPNGNFLFVSNQQSNTITVLQVAANGSLSLVPGSPFANPGGDTPQQLALNQAGTLLYANNDNGVTSAFSVAGNGTVTAVPGSPFATGSGLRPGISAFPPKSCGPIFDLCLQDESNGNILQVNVTTGAYQFTNCAGSTIGGVGTITKKGCLITLEANGPDRRVLARIDTCNHNGTATVQIFSPTRTFSILDRNTSNNNCTCPST